MSALDELFGDTGCVSDSAPLLGDVISAEDDCQQGKSSVLQMVQFFEALGRPKKYEAAAEAIYASYERAENSFWRSMPFSSACSAIRDAGVQAQALMQQMAADAGIEAPPGPPQPDSPTRELINLGKGLALLAAFLVGAPLVRDLLSSRKRP